MKRGRKEGRREEERKKLKRYITYLNRRNKSGRYSMRLLNIGVWDTVCTKLNFCCCFQGISLELFFFEAFCSRVDELLV